MAEMIAASLSAKVAAAFSRTAAVYLASLVAIRPGIAAAARDLELLRAFLRFADSRRGTDVLANAWVDQVRDVGFELEDVADEYTFLSGSGFVRACADVRAWFALSRRLRKARERLRALSAVKEQYGIRPAEASVSGSAPDGGTAAGICRTLSEAAHFVEEEIGFAAHKRLLMKWLTGDADPQRTIVAVCGRGFPYSAGDDPTKVGDAAAGGDGDEEDKNRPIANILTSLDGASRRELPLLELNKGAAVEQDEEVVSESTTLVDGSGAPKRRAVGGAGDADDASPAQQHRRLWVKDRSSEWWAERSSPNYPEAAFRREFRMSRATFDMVCDALGSAVAKEDSALRAKHPGPAARGRPCGAWPPAIPSASSPSASASASPPATSSSSRSAPPSAPS